MRTTRFFPILLLTLLLSGCWSGSAKYEGLSFPRTSASQVHFQEQSIPADCSVFAHLLMSSRTGASGREIATAMQQEAQSKGASHVLLGHARELVDEKLKEERFDYYGPDYAYSFSRTWLGWKFGFGEWNHAGNLVGLGMGAWDREDVKFDNSLLIQAVFLRCGE